MIFGCQVALIFGGGVTLISTIIGVIIGSLAGYFGKLVDTVLMRITEFLLVIPSYFIYLLVMSAIRSNDWKMLMVMMGMLQCGLSWLG